MLPARAGPSSSVVNHPPRAPLPFVSLTVIDDHTPRPAGLNMALDEVLLVSVDDAVILRCYRWSVPSVSFGCFGPVTHVRRDHPGRSLVRRWTGGGIVEHTADFTFSLLVSRRQPLAAIRARDSYGLVHEAVGGALSRAVVGAVSAASPPRPSTDVRDASHLQPCFAHPVAHDLLVGGRKVAGGAQRRTRHGMLHQGSIQGLFGAGGPDESMRRTLSHALAAALGRTTTARQITPDELARAAELAGRKYDSPAWTERF